MRFYSLILLLGMIFVTQSALATDKSKGSCSAWQEECAKSKDPKSCFPGRCGDWGEHDYLAEENEGYGYGGNEDDHEINIQESKKQKKPASPAKMNKKAKAKKTSVMSCKTAFIAGQKSPSTGDVMEAAEVCESATQKACAKNSDGTGDGRYVTAACFLNAAYKGNLAVNENKAGAKCEKAYKEGMDSPSTGDVMSAIDACKEDTQAICAKLADGTGDGRLIAANCVLTAAHGGFIGVTVKEKKKPVDANLCGGKAKPRICKGNCYVNYECRNDKWEKSPIESCALCGDGLKMLDAIDIHKGESKTDGAQ